MGFIETILTGVVVFPFLAAVFTFPYAMHQYHRYGAVSKTRTLVMPYDKLSGTMYVAMPLPKRGAKRGR